MSSTRRDFLATTSLAVTGAIVGRATNAQPILSNFGSSQLSANTFLQAAKAPDDLRALALSAIDSAKSAGASYADIRVAEKHMLSVESLSLEPNVRIESGFTYGIRAIVNGAWAFVYGTTPTGDAVADSARNAVATARGYASVSGHRTRQRVELAPVPLAIGEWRTPIQIDPFDVPIGDQTALLYALRGAATRVKYGHWGSGPKFNWTRETRVFASSEDSLCTQTFYRSEPILNGAADLGMGMVALTLPQLGAISGGYETVTASGLQEDIKNLTEEAVKLASLPRRSIDVGRYPVVFDGTTFGAAVARTVGRALELDRVLGYEADASGTSFLGPPLEILGKQFFSPLLNVAASRALPNINAVKWDDDGVMPGEYSVIDNGHVVDYHTSRQTAPALAAWYGAQGMPVRSNGCAVTTDPENTVMVRTPHLDIAPDKGRASVEDLCKEIAHGILIREVDHFSTDQQLSSGSLMYGGELFEIERGKIVRRIEGNGFQFNTERFFRSIAAIGDTGTVRKSTFQSGKSYPWTWLTQSATAPAALFKEINVMRTKIRL